MRRCSLAIVTAGLGMAWGMRTWDGEKNPKDEALVQLLSSKKNTSPAAVWELLASGSSPSAVSDYNYTALMWSVVRHKPPEVVRVLLEAEADIEAINAWGRNAMFLAAWERQTESMRLMLEHGANATSCAQHDEWSALHKAAEMGHIEQARACARAAPSHNLCAGSRSTCPWSCRRRAPA